MPLPLGLRIVPYKEYKKGFVKSIDNMADEYKALKQKNTKGTKNKKIKLKKTLKH